MKIPLKQFQSTLALLFLLGNLPSGIAQESPTPTWRDPQAVAEVLAGTRTEANVLWWGYDEEDSTDFVQAAIDSGAPKLVVPVHQGPWIVRPIVLRSRLELVFEPGVLVLAKKGEFQGGGDSLFRADDKEDIKIVGYGATLRMRKKDYQSEDYKKAEWRMGLAFTGCKRVQVEGVRVESSGGDGIYIGSSVANRWCEDIVVRNVTCHDNHRQGMSVISAQNLVVENCVFSDTGGTPPEAGIDFEPDSPDERFVNCVVRNCLFENNSGHEILVYLKPLTQESEPVSIRFENCHSRMGRTAGLSPEDFKHQPEMTGWAGMSVGAARDNGPRGLVEFVDCSSENTGKEGAKVYDKSADSVKVRFVRCSWKSAWVSRHREYGGPRCPILLHVRRSEITQRPGGIEFIDCQVFDNTWAPAIRFEQDEGDVALRDVTGTLTVFNPAGVKSMLGEKREGVTLELVDGLGHANPSNSQ